MYTIQQLFCPIWTVSNVDNDVWEPEKTPPTHSIVEFENQGKKYQNFVFKSDNQRFVSRSSIVFVNQIDNNN